MHISFMLCGCFLRRCRLFRSILVFFFLRFWLRLETTSRWVGSEFSCHWCCLLRRLFGVDSLCSSWFSRYDFWWFDFYALFHSSRMAPRFVDFILSIFICLFSHFHCWSHLLWLSLSPYLLLQVWLVFFSVYALCAWKISNDLKLKLWFLVGWLPFSSTQVIYLLLTHPLV